jgi:nitroreductase
MTANPLAPVLLTEKREPHLPRASDAFQHYLLTRRSVSAQDLAEPGPNAAQLEAILRIAARVPDHKKRAPWRFIIFEGEARAAFGEVLADITRRRDPEASPKRLDTERGRFLRAPVVVAVISSMKPHPSAPEWEQVLSAGAACMNLLHGAAAFGFSGNWITEWYAYDAEVMAALGLGESERVAGFVYLGTAQDAPKERERPDVAAITGWWVGRGSNHRS